MSLYMSPFKEDHHQTCPLQHSSVMAYISEHIAGLRQPHRGIHLPKPLTGLWHHRSKTSTKMDWEQGNLKCEILLGVTAAIDWYTLLAANKHSLFSSAQSLFHSSCWTTAITLEVHTGAATMCHCYFAFNQWFACHHFWFGQPMIYRKDLQRY